MPNATLQSFQAVRNELLIYRVLPVLKSLGNVCAKVTFTAPNEAYAHIQGNRNLQQRYEKHVGAPRNC